jgi:hypothetical protein
MPSPPCDDPADDRAQGVDVVREWRDRPDGRLVVVRVTGDHPQRQRHGVRRAEQLADAEQFRGLLRRRVGHASGLTNAVGHLTGRRVGEDLVEHDLGGDRRGDGGRDRACHALWVRVGDPGGGVGLGGRTGRVTGEPGTQRRGPHGAAVAPRAGAVERPRRQVPEALALLDPPHHRVDAGPVAAADVVVRDEGGGQGVRVDVPVGVEHVEYPARHLGVVGPPPRIGDGPAPAFQEDPLAVRVAHRRAHQACP